MVSLPQCAGGRRPSRAAPFSEPSWTKVGSFFGDVANLASGAVSAVADVAKGVLNEAASLVSLIPGVGSGISAGIQAGLAFLAGGSALDIAIHAAYGALPIPPGVRDVTDSVLAAVLSLVDSGNIGAAALAAARTRVPSGFPQQVFDTLVQLIAHHQAALNSPDPKTALTAVRSQLAAATAKANATMANVSAMQAAAAAALIARGLDPHTGQPLPPSDPRYVPHIAPLPTVKAAPKLVPLKVAIVAPRAASPPLVRAPSPPSTTPAVAPPRPIVIPPPRVSSPSSPTHAPAAATPRGISYFDVVPHPRPWPHAYWRGGR
jgi:hypothetical protein